MRIEHVAIWTHDLERLKTFYETYFGALSGKKYVNPTSGFESYFLSFAGGARLELMQKPGIPTSLNNIDAQFTGYVHLAIGVGAESEVDALTRRLGAEGYRVMDGPRRTGDGYYESVVLDPDGNRVEICAS